VTSPGASTRIWRPGARGLAAVALMVMGAAAGCGSAQGGAGATAYASSPRAPARLARVPARLGHPTRHSGCRVRASLPDPGCTPGSVFTAASVGQICTPGYARGVRNVTASERAAVYAAYGIAPGQGRRYELDHLVPLEVGGDNSQANLWPEVAPGYGAKDVVENELHRAVCARRVSLRVAQERIARDWRRAGVPVPAAASPAPGPTGGDAGFCSTHRCIANFDNGRGSIVQCRDGEWSHSGGLSGACSGHGGVRS
jgi:hypothetical protein